MLNLQVDTDTSADERSDRAEPSTTHGLVPHVLLFAYVWLVCFLLAWLNFDTNWRQFAHQQLPALVGAQPDGELVVAGGSMLLLLIAAFVLRSW